MGYIYNRQIAYIFLITLPIWGEVTESGKAGKLISKVFYTWLLNVPVHLAKNKIVERCWFFFEARTILIEGKTENFEWQQAEVTVNQNDWVIRADVDFPWAFNLVLHRFISVLSCFISCNYASLSFEEQGSLKKMSCKHRATAPLTDFFKNIKQHFLRINCPRVSVFQTIALTINCFSLNFISSISLSSGDNWPSWILTPLHRYDCAISKRTKVFLREETYVLLRLYNDQNEM